MGFFYLFMQPLAFVDSAVTQYITLTLHYLETYSIKLIQKKFFTPFGHRNSIPLPISTWLPHM